MYDGDPCTQPPHLPCLQVKQRLDHSVASTLPHPGPEWTLLALQIRKLPTQGENREGYLSGAGLVL